MPDTKIHFSKNVHVFVDGEEVDLPARRNDWIEFTFEEDISSLEESLYGGGHRVITESTRGTLTIRTLATSTWLNFRVPLLREKTLEQGYFSVSIIDQNRDTKLTIETEFGGLVRDPSTKRGGPDLDNGEVSIDGFWRVYH